MREIKFRGFGKYSKEWVFGDLIHGVGSKSGRYYILPHRVNLIHVKFCDPLDGVEVDEETIGQFTGLKDKNGVEIYELDYLKNPKGKIGIVVFFDGSFKLKVKETKESVTYIDLNQGFCNNKTIIGNEFEHKHLLQ